MESPQALLCPESHYRFNISLDEYEFHKRKGFALPRIHFDLRMLKAARKTAVLKSYPYKCIYCGNDIMAYYPPEWGYKKIACEECYKQNIA
jgi:DNA-directed RNA polymerase subunit RPC12/RpoP